MLLCLFPLDAQQEYAESYIHISASVSLAEALDEIESQTNYSFIYDARVINLSEKLRSPLSGRTVFEILNLLFKDRTIVYTVMNDQIILSKKETIIQIQQKLDGKIKGCLLYTSRCGMRLFWGIRLSARRSRCRSFPRNGSSRMPYGIHPGAPGWPWRPRPSVLIYKNQDSRIAIGTWRTISRALVA